MNTKHSLVVLFVLVLTAVALPAAAQVAPPDSAFVVHQSGEAEAGQALLPLAGLALVLVSVAVIIGLGIVWRRNKTSQPQAPLSSGPDTQPLADDFFMQYSSPEPAEPVAQRGPYPPYTSMPTRRQAIRPMHTLLQTAYLVEVSAPNQPVHTVRQGRNTIGCDATLSSITIQNDTQVAALQAHIIAKDGQFWLANLAEETPLTINNSPVQRATRLSSGDEIVIGVQTRLLFQLQSLSAGPDDADSPTEIG